MSEKKDATSSKSATWLRLEFEFSENMWESSGHASFSAMSWRFKLLPPPRPSKLPGFPPVATHVTIPAEAASLASFIIFQCREKVSRMKPIITQKCNSFWYIWIIVLVYPCVARWYMYVYVQLMENKRLHFHTFHTFTWQWSNGQGTQSLLRKIHCPCAPRAQFELAKGWARKACQLKGFARANLKK